MNAVTEVIVVGAGLAGIAAATRLEKRGVRVIVLEAKDSPGGRAATSEALGRPVDLGASWLHGTRDHPLHDRARARGLPLVPFDYDSLALYRADGEPEPTAAGTMDRFEDALERLGRGAKRHDSVQDRMARLEGGAGDELPAALRDFLVATVLEEEYAADVHELAARALEEGRSMRGGDAILQGGYAALYRPLCSRLDIRFRTAVSEIDLGGDGVTVITSAGRFTADQLILTVPLGVLKGDALRIVPPLPAPQRRAIDALGMGLCNKLYLKFPRVFWDEEVQTVGYQHPERGRWLSWYNYARVTGLPVLLGFCTGTAAVSVEALDDDATVADAMAVLRRIYGPAIPEPEAAIVTRWGRDPHSLGAYSFLRVGARPSQRDELATPVLHRLLIAGEATDRRYPGTTQGAWRAGRRAAKAVLKLRRP
ncbi:NAD(P)/FAD-dependent oxidoreductase [Pseudohaliea sp.]|uniref:flavin monoamine oxidase family protein n=1 Tax=Pseudohaliea sp. TaxID=2740289 RepID=UPI0032EC280D